MSKLDTCKTSRLFKPLTDTDLWANKGSQPELELHKQSRNYITSKVRSGVTPHYNYAWEIKAREVAVPLIDTLGQQGRNFGGETNASCGDSAARYVRANLPT
ncbi:Hypp2899 [Branchiostoma lanceolatum]|uniref:Hypp2899 protein n=1 Tax=Branchiostoma lanceolatum TaxID=7740 RepID=A0A8J9ZY86_BRALA|nr:Hypp2899 [Branchiostoma lanceolatum]